MHGHRKRTYSTNFIIGRAYKVKVNANRQETVRKRNKMTRT